MTGPQRPSTVNWTEDDCLHSVRWHSESGAAAPPRVVVIDDETTANHAYRLARSGTGLLWRGDYHNARQLLTAIGRRIDRVATRRGDGSSFAAHRAQRTERARILGALIVQLDDEYSLGLRRAPEVRQACVEAYGEPQEAMCIALTELLGVISASQWHEKGVPIPALDARIQPCYGVFSPIRGEYIDLVARAPLHVGARVAFDLGTGTGVLAALLARRGIGQVTATDINPRAVACSRANIARLGYREQVDVVEADLYPSGRADLIVCNPPWLPGRPSSALEQGVYDEDSQMLYGFLDGLSAHLSEGGEGWLILSDLAEHLGERATDHLAQRFAAAGLRVVGRLDTTPTHRRSKDSSDRFHAARSRERTSLWRLRPDDLGMVDP